jgi:hypothetical protein
MPVAMIFDSGQQYSGRAFRDCMHEAVHPQAAIISVGRHNTFGHPGPSTLATLKRAAATIYRTDSCGAATLTETRMISTVLQCWRETGKLGRQLRLIHGLDPHQNKLYHRLWNQATPHMLPYGVTRLC